MSERFNVLLCKLYILAVVGIIIELLDNMHGVTMKLVIEFIRKCKLCRPNYYIDTTILWRLLVSNPARY